MNEREIEFLARCHLRFWDSLSTQAARSYLTRFKCTRPMRRQRRITSCFARSVRSAASASSRSNSSVRHTVCLTIILLFSFMRSSVVEFQTFGKNKKLVKNTTLR